MVGGPDDGVGSARGWGVFDPMANAQALAEVQAQALRAAGDLVERLARTVDGVATNAQANGATGNAEATSGTSPAGDALRLVETWIELLQRASSSFTQVMTGAPAAAGGQPPSPGPQPAAGGTPAPASPGERVDVDLADAVSHATLRIEVADSAAVGGAAGSAEAWLHNGSPESVGPLRLHAGELRAPDGTLLAGTLTCEPVRIDDLPGRSSRGVVVALQPHGRLRPGTYRGLLQVEGAAAVWLTVEIVVAGTNGAR
jgi:hypothetical protein